MNDLNPLTQFNIFSLMLCYMVILCLCNLYTLPVRPLTYIYLFTSLIMYKDNPHDEYLKCLQFFVLSKNFNNIFKICKQASRIINSNACPGFEVLVGEKEFTHHLHIYLHINGR